MLVGRMAQTYYVTTPIYYVNDVPHIGHSYTTIAADVLARYFRAEGRDVRFLTGTDEHGIKIVKAAAEKGVSPKQLADQVVVHFQELWKDLNISNDDFIRTSSARHEKRVQALVQRLVEKDEIYAGNYEGLYDEGQEEFVTESVAREHDYCSPVNGRPLVRYSEPVYFFRLRKWIPRLLEHIRSNPGFIQPDARRNEVLSKLAQGPDDLCISRAMEKLDHWGVPMPNDPTHSVYVWIDALSNYYTALGLPEIGDGGDGKAARYWPADVHLIGKDILWFHTVYWPCMLMALDIPLPRRVFAHGWWTSEGKKMSKSLGNFISRETIAEICREYSVDVYRYFLLRAVPFGSDGDFSRDMLRTRYNAELANGIGNLLSRTVNMIERYFDGAVPAPGSPPGAAEAAVIAAAADLRESAPTVMETCRFHVYLDKISAVEAATNRYIDATQPFKLAKDPARRDRLATILHTCAEAVRIVLLYLRPVMPEAADRGLEQLGAAAGAEALSRAAEWGRVAPQTRTHKGESLFPRKDA
ncbi:MAG TPA: methionine--tRNA ligase [Phycisphaerae bacterium]|nr:methionine--tRNA ligase [Phycisphaerae bacterium]